MLVHREFPCSLLQLSGMFQCLYYQFLIENDLSLFLSFGFANNTVMNNLIQTFFCRCVGIFLYKFPEVGKL